MRYDGWFRLSRELGLPLTECLTRTSYRQYRIWMAWLELQFEIPDRSDFYTMQATAEIARAGMEGKSRSKVQMKHFLLRFDKPKEAAGDKVQRSKSAWAAVTGAAEAVPEPIGKAPLGKPPPGKRS